jgi:hypothetical protein
VFIILALLTLLASSLVACVCPELSAFMGVCSVVSLIYGSRLQRYVAVALLIIAIAAFIAELAAWRIENRRPNERAERMGQHREQRAAQ